MSTITITFGQQAQNSRGMQKIGKIQERGYSKQDLIIAKQLFEKKGFKCQLVNLNDYVQEQAEEAYILVIRKGVEALLNQDVSAKQLFTEMVCLQWDKKFLNYGKVMNKRARYNLCFGNQSQQPFYQLGKGRIIPWHKVPLLSQLRMNLGVYLKGADELVAQGNYYYDNEKCGVKFHGDEQRKKVIAIRLCSGLCPPIHYQWFIKGKPIGKRAIIQLQDRDVYIMSQKATGNDEHKKDIPTLKHATGGAKFTTIDQ